MMATSSPLMEALLQNPNPNPDTSKKSLNAQAKPYVTLGSSFFPPPVPPQLYQIPQQNHSLLPPPFVVSYSPGYVYHQPYPVQMVYYNILKQPSPVRPIYPQASSKEAECYSSTQTQPLPPKMLRPFFPRYDYVEKDFGADKKWLIAKNRSGDTCYAPRFRSKSRSLEGCKVKKKKSLGSNKGFVGDESGGCHGNKVIGVVHLTPEKTSLMIRNIPNKFERHDLLKILDKHCLEQNMAAKLRCDPVRSKYDFVYLPMDFKTGLNLGYAFVNFTSQIAASRFRDDFKKFKWEVPNNKKICEVSNAVIQGKDALRNHFRNSVFPCHTNDYLPVVFSPPRNGSNCSRFDLVGRRLNVPRSLTK